MGVFRYGHCRDLAMPAPWIARLFSFRVVGGIMPPQKGQRETHCLSVRLALIADGGHQSRFLKMLALRSAVCLCCIVCLTWLAWTTFFFLIDSIYFVGPRMRFE